ncbi:hypothetical protein [Novosphingobium sp. AP12]|nr:hypothetical protein [Novosphingobium sp. AP12]
MPLSPTLAALALGDDLVFAQELASSFLEGLLGLEDAGVQFALAW